MDIVKFLLRHNANVNEQDHDGWTPLEAAAQEGHHDIVDYLALYEADMHVREIDGLTPVGAAAKHNPSTYNQKVPHPLEVTRDEEETRDPRYWRPPEISSQEDM